MRADLILLEANPLQDVSALRRNLGVMAHGVWMDRAALGEALDGLAALYAEPDGATVDPTQAIELAGRLQAEAAKGFAFDSMSLAGAAGKLREIGLTQAAIEFDRLADIPTTPPCAAWTPG
jgi:hypothetical protein